ncbi:hypothetical protein ACLKA7_015905 [Drosophila subpalustris]
MSRLARIGLIVLLATLLHSAVDVEATCGYCYGSHACVDNSTFQICFDGVPRPEYSVRCPAEKPICTKYGEICMSLDMELKPTCGDVSNCGQCDSDAIFACTTHTSFGKCVDGVLANPNRITCPSGYFCSVKGAPTGNPCVAGCEPDPNDTCDRETESNDGSSTTESPTTSSPTTSSPTPTPTPSTSVNATAVCQREQKAGRIAIPNDTVCTSFIHCNFKANAWQGAVNNCPTNKPYFRAATTCGIIKPTGAGCV